MGTKEKKEIEFITQESGKIGSKVITWQKFF